MTGETTPPHSHTGMTWWPRYGHEHCVRIPDGWICEGCKRFHDHNPPYCYGCGYTVLGQAFRRP